MPKKELKTAIKITKHLNKLLLKRFGNFNVNDIQHKKHREVVTSVDLESNKYITGILLKNFPDQDIISEEAKKIDNPGTKTWYIDPLDGTTNFAYGSTEFSTCIGLENKGEILLGAIGVPARNKIYWCQKDGGAWCDKKKIKVSARNNLRDAMFLLCPGHSPKGKDRFEKYFGGGKNMSGHWRFFGSAGIELSSVADGRADACILSDIHPWDVVAGILLVREAGGRVTNFAGDEWKIGDETLVASNGVIHDKVLELTRDLE
ncbi:inositol monophosphatase [Patescibacteria group bacterium]|nr:inositol monophosphatase [Patescibacteria group bacterium]